ncbi:hypothetical protein D1872_304780 [compost metagenome]
MKQGDELHMKSALIEKFPHLAGKVNYKELLSSFEMPKHKDGVIILNPDNQVHANWLDDEEGEHEE